MMMGLSPFLTPGIVGLLAILLLLALRVALLKVLFRWAEKTATRLDDAILSAFRKPSIGWCVVLGVWVGFTISDLPPKPGILLSRLLQVILILSVTAAAANLAGKLFETYVRAAQLPLPATGLVQGLLKGVIIVPGMLIILGVLGISITPLLTALGVGGLAVALGLQDTLANLFAGLHILVEKSVRLGDFVRLEGGQEGVVADITWRTTRIRLLSNNIVVVPNGKLAHSIVTNFSLPEERMSLLIPISVSYDSDPKRVEQVLTEEAVKAAPEVPGMLGEPAPFVRFIPGYGESSLDFTLICQVRGFVDQYLVQHELRKRIFNRFQREAIEIPYPHRTVYLRKE